MRQDSSNLLDDLKRIIEIDFKRHHLGRDYSLEYAIESYMKYVSMGLGVVVANNVAINYSAEGSTVEFHCMNAGTGEDLTKSINDFLKSISGKYDRAVTYYDNPRINDLVKYSYFPAQFSKIDKGEDKTYELSFDLRGK